MTAAAARPTHAVEDPDASWVAPDISGLVTADDAPVDDILSEKQERLLTEPLYSSWSGPPPGDDGEPRRFAALANVGLFSSPGERPVVPDMMLSVDVTIADDLGEKMNRSYFIWQFGKPPEVVVEIVSNRDGGELGERFGRYRRMRVSYYVVYDPLHALGEPVLRSFELRGDLYVPVERRALGARKRARRGWRRGCVSWGSLRTATGEARRGRRDRPVRYASGSSSPKNTPTFSSIASNGSARTRSPRSAARTSMYPSGPQRCTAKVSSTGSMIQQRGIWH